MKESDFELLEKIFGSKSTATFVVKNVEAAKELGCGLTSERTSDAMLRHQRSGRRMSAIPPYGMMVDPENDSRLVPNADEQKAIRRVLELKGQSKSLRQIAQQLTEEGYEPRKVKKKFKDSFRMVNGKWWPSLITKIIDRADRDREKN